MICTTERNGLMANADSIAAAGSPATETRRLARMLLQGRDANSNE